MMEVGRRARHTDLPFVDGTVVSIEPTIKGDYIVRLLVNEGRGNEHIISDTIDTFELLEDRPQEIEVEIIDSPKGGW